MPKCHQRYVIRNYRGKRGHGSCLTDIVTQPPAGSCDAGNTFEAGWTSPTAPYTDNNGKTQTASFAFWSITGGANGAIVSTNNTAPAIIAGTSEIFAIAWYIPLGGGNGGPAIFVDAFDVDAGTFVDDDFVSVIPDKVPANQPTITQDANNLGTVPTDVERNVSAYAQLPNEKIPFSNWQVVWESQYSSPASPSKMSTSGQVLDAKAGAVAVAFAFYQTSGSTVIPQTQTGGYIPGSISIGFQAMLWLEAEWMAALVRRLNLKTLPPETERTFSAISGRCGITIPHIHYQGKTYLMTTDQWTEFASDVQKRLSEKLAHAKSITFSKLVQIHEAIAELT